MNLKHTVGFAALSLAFTAPSFADELNVVCSNSQPRCDLMAENFGNTIGVDVTMVRKSTGEALTQIRAEAGNPKVDVWWGGTGDPHLIAAAEGLTQASGVETDGLHPWALKMASISEGKTIGIHAGALGIGYNTDILEEKGLEPPACWKDLADPKYAGEIQVANPNSSGTAYTELATLTQLFGEDEGFKLLAAIGENVIQYTKSGSAPSKAAARGKTTIAIGFMGDMVKLRKTGFPLNIVSPCEGTGYEIGGVSVIKGARNAESAKKWVKFALTAEAQMRGSDAGVYSVPSNMAAKLDSDSPDLSAIKLIDYDFATYGSSETRNRLLARWDAEVKK